jgi:hypothetical protein
MTQSKAETGKYQVPLEVYHLLAKATPEEKTEIMLRLIEEHPEGRLELHRCGVMRLNLSKVNLGRLTLRAKVEQSRVTSPPWWDPDKWGVNLQDADLTFVNL